MSAPLFLENYYMSKFLKQLFCRQKDLKYLYYNDAVCGKNAYYQCKKCQKKITKNENEYKY